MAVAPSVMGNNTGSLLGAAVIEGAKSMGAEKIFLESNSILKPAINLYKKLGFKKVSGMPSPYKRCNIHMKLKL